MEQKFELTMSFGGLTLKEAETLRYQINLLSLGLLKRDVCMLEETIREEIHEE